MVLELHLRHVVCEEENVQMGPARAIVTLGAFFAAAVLKFNPCESGDFCGLPSCILGREDVLGPLPVAPPLCLLILASQKPSYNFHEHVCDVQCFTSWQTHSRQQSLLHFVA